MTRREFNRLLNNFLIAKALMESEQPDGGYPPPKLLRDYIAAQNALNAAIDESLDADEETG